ncbi:nuclear receptor coactivator 7-like isoform X1 [Acipenser ruthenus]|uniref:nuclear receptor coactivator 7-like isoform X1 n=2 Tax=Acipenser ruthenus TaxID=7906 RepID=UPI002741803D|nr:nuclear receptor coactivator 7-like isoform X1 [Acipenser ruthenus]XP_034764548.2 nuclear receptor coactivator 7-like isoform X1 [Acipenser ruthenus]
MDRNPQRQERHKSYFNNVKSRLGKLNSTPQIADCPSSPSDQPPSSQQRGEDSDPCWTPPSNPNRSGLHTRPIRHPELRKYYLMDSIPLQEETKAKGTVWDQPHGTVEYTVHSKDTLFSVASQFHTTPSQLMKWNRLYTQTLLPGQRLYVPALKLPSPQGAASLPPGDRAPDSPTSCPPSSPLTPSLDAEYDKLLDVEAVPMPDGQLCLLALPPECSAAQEEEPVAVRYLKLCCRYITDRKGVVTGILLVTPNKIFFDPYKSHPLVLEHGCEEYLLSCAIDSLVSVSFFSDISGVHFTRASPLARNKKVKKPKALNLESLKRGVRPSPGIKSASPSDPQQDTGSILPTSPPPPDSCLSSLLGRKLTVEDKNIWQECLTGPQETLAHSQTAWAAMDSGQGQGGRLGEFRGRENLEEGYVNVGAGVLGSAATFCCGGGGAEWSGKGIRMEKVKAGVNEKENALLDKQFKRVIRSPFFVTSPGPSKQPAALSALRFLRLRLQVPLKRKSVFSPEHRADKRQQSRDVWFTLTQDKSDELYAYLSYWRPDLYIMEGGGEEEEEEFVLVDDEEEISPTENHSAPHVVEDWEIISVDDGGGEQAKEPEALTDILEQSNIMEESHIRELSSHLPLRILIHSWQLAYSTSLHGSSLKTLYRKLSQRESPALLVIKDFHNQIFGCFVSHPLRLSDSFYGTGETFLFTFYPEFKCFHWTGANSFFIKGDLDSVAIGGGSGHFGLWLDENLYLGRSSPCSTFDNDTLSETADFRVLELEVWNFY